MVACIVLRCAPFFIYGIIIYVQSYPKLIIATSLKSAELPENVRVPNTDVRHFVSDNLSIADARLLIEQSSRQAFTDSRQTFVIVVSNINTEAQNALLKLFEEPPESAEFYLVIPHETLLIPTLRSRFVLAVSKSTNASSVADEFLQMSYKDRLDLVALKVKDKDVKWVGELVASLGAQSHSLSSESKRALALCERYVRNRGASKKILLESLALSLPA